MQNSILNQALSETNFRPSRQHIVEVKSHLNSNMSNILLEVLCHFIGMDNVCQEVHPSQLYLALKQGRRSRKTGYRWVARLVELGLITTERRGFNQTLVYKLKPIFYDKAMRRAVNHLLKSLNFVKISLLLLFGLNNCPYVKNPYIWDHPELLEENVPLRDIGYINYRYSTRSDKTTAEGPSPGKAISHRSGVKTQDARRGIVMKNVKKVKRLKLTRAGEIKLMAFPKEAIEYADKNIRTVSTPVEKLFRYYYKMLITYCDTHKIKPEWRVAFTQLQKEGIDKDADGIDPKDPFEYDLMMPESMDPTAHLDDKSTSDKRVKPTNGAYADAKPPTLRPKMEVEVLKSTSDAMLEIGKSYGDGMLNSILESMRTCMIQANIPR